MTNRIFLSAPDVSGRERDLVHEVFESNYVAPAGEMLTRFENDICTYTGFANAVALSSGTAALHLTLHMMGIKAGDEIWTSSMTFVGGIAPILYVGATPVFFDLSATDWNMSLDLLEEALIEANKSNRLPRAIITTDLYGQAMDMDRAKALGSQFGVTVISDSAEALGAFRNGKHAGKGAKAAVLSFNGNKIITSSGGGMLLSDDAELISRARYLSTQARQPAIHYEHTEVGFNYRLSNVSAAIGVGQLEMIEQKVAKRREIHNRYVQTFGELDGVTFMPEPQASRSTRWLTCMAIDKLAATDRHIIQDACEQASIEVRPMWKPMHMQKLFDGSKLIGSGLCADLFETGMCLPSGSGMTFEEQDRVIETILTQFQSA